MDGAFTFKTEETYESEDGKTAVTLITDQEGQMVRIQIRSQLLMLGINTFDEVVSAVEALQDRARDRRNGR